jgi:HlyD family secretion protein
MRLLFLISAFMLVGCNSIKKDTFNGYVEGEFRLLSSLESGVIAEIKVSKGTFVIKDTVLAVMETTDAKLSVEQAEASYSLAKSEFERSLILVKDGVISKADAEKIATEFEKTKAEFDHAKWHLNKYTLKAPEDGYIQEILRYEGELATPQNPVIYFLPKTNIKIRFFVPQHQLANITLGQKVAVKVDDQTKPITATVRFVSNQAEFTPPIIYSNSSREKLVFMIEAVVDDQSNDLPLKPGQPVDIQLSAVNE